MGFHGSVKFCNFFYCCITIYTSVQFYAVLCVSVHSLHVHARLWISMHFRALLCTSTLFYSLMQRTPLQLYNPLTPICTSMHFYALLCTSLRIHTLLRSSASFHALLPNFMHFYALQRTSMHLCAPPCTSTLYMYLYVSICISTHFYTILHTSAH